MTRANVEQVEQNVWWVSSYDTETGWHLDSPEFETKGEALAYCDAKGYTVNMVIRIDEDNKTA